MMNPRYLTISHHNIYYFRFPIPNIFHPQNKNTDIKLSLNTRCPKEALTDGDYSFVGTDDQLNKVINSQGLDIRQGSKDYNILREEYLKASRDYFESMLGYDADINISDEAAQDVKHMLMQIPKNARRLIPIHKDLIEVGLLDYVEKLKQGNKDRLLYELSYDKNNGYGRNLSRWFNEKFLKELDTKTKGLVFHRTRHSVVAYLLQAGVQENIAKSISGHAREGVVQNVYAKGYKTSQLKEAIDLLYDDLPDI